MFFYSPSLNSFMHFNRLFEQRCINIMDRMYEENTKSAIDSMDDEAVVWGIHSSPLTFAYENFMYDIVAHTCSQKNMNKQWYNNLAPDLMPFLKVKDLALYKNITGHNAKDYLSREEFNNFTFQQICLNIIVV